MEDVAAGASKQTSSLQHMIRKLVTTWNASTPLSSGANTRQPLNFKVLHLVSDETQCTTNSTTIVK
jgi:hypothetical protein